MRPSQKVDRHASATAEAAEQRLTEFEVKWDADYRSIGLSWRRHWARVTPFFDYPPEIRKVIYTTNAIESINMGLRKIIKNRSSLPTDEAIADYLGWYNTQRPHSSLERLTPHEKYVAALPQLKLAA